MGKGQAILTSGELVVRILAPVAKTAFALIVRQALIDAAPVVRRRM